MNIIGEKIIIRALEIEDLVFLKKWANDPEIQYMVGGWHFPISSRDQDNWYNKAIVNQDNKRFVVENNSKKVIGMCNLININFKDGNAEIGLIIDKSFRGKGYGKDIVFSLMNYAFNELRLNRLETTIIDTNIASKTLFLSKCGWKKEGELRNWYFRDGKMINKNYYGILKEEFLKLEI